MKALVLESPGQLVMRDVARPIPAKDELLIQTKAATICTSDLHDIKYNPFNISLPIIMGHEGGGIVAGIGSGVEDFKIGDEITAHPVIPCRVCVSCKRGLGHLCDNMGHLGFDRGGVFAEYFTIRRDRVRKKPSCLSFAQSTLMEPVCVCIEAIERANIKDNSNILIIGDGPFGIIMSRICNLYKNVNVILIGRHAFRLGFAKNAFTINQKTCDNVSQEILIATGNQGVDSAILCVGTNEALDLGIESLRARGTLSVFSGISQKVSVDMFKLHVKELNICGSCNDMDYIDRALSYLIDENLGLNDVITQEVPFDNFREAFDLAENCKDQALKVSMLF